MHEGIAMSRVQLALNVDNVETAVAFYSKLFGTEPAKRRPGYANFAITEPPLKLVLLENPGSGGSLNHLGVEVEESAAVEAHQARLAADGLVVSEEKGTTCCYAVQDKFWVTAPDGEKWEHYAVLADSQPELEGQTRRELSMVAGDGSCCTTDEAGATVC
jgi:catechol 2,3-dioxygenase-like lactoylglutathione lyase family enzyme